MSKTFINNSPKCCHITCQYSKYLIGFGRCSKFGKLKMDLLNNTFYCHDDCDEVDINKINM